MLRPASVIWVEGMNVCIEYNALNAILKIKLYMIPVSIVKKCHSETLGMKNIDI